MWAIRTNCKSVALQGKSLDFGPDQFLRKASGDDKLWADLAKELHSAQQKETALPDKAPKAVDASKSMPHIETANASELADKEKEKAAEKVAEIVDAKARDRLLMFSGKLPLRFEYTSVCFRMIAELI